MLVQFPTHAYMRDPQYFPNPDEFNPENFSPKNKASRSPYAYLSFGQGPRNCVGMRFALLNIKVAFARLLLNYR